MGLPNSETVVATAPANPITSVPVPTADTRYKVDVAVFNPGAVPVYLTNGESVVSPWRVPAGQTFVFEGIFLDEVAGVADTLSLYDPTAAPVNCQVQVITRARL